MKKALALILSLALIISGLVLPGATMALAETDSQVDAELTFSDAITVLGEDINPRAIRTKVLSDGTVAAVYYRSGSGIYYATSNNGGVTFSEGVKLIGNATDSVLAASEEVTTQTTLAKEYVATYGQYGRGRLEAQNPNLIELKNGDVAAFYRYNTFETDPANKPWSIYYASICYQILDKDTGVWGDVQVMYECTQENVVADSGSPYGVWEPDPVYIGDELFCYFADTDLPGNVSYQHIMYCVFDETTGKFGAPAIAQNGIEHKSRDGMSVVTQLSDGTYAMVFESTRTANNDYDDINNYTTFVIKMSFSEDGRNWSDPVIVAKPNPVSTPATASDEYAVCCAPYVVTLPDGRLAVSYQTTDRYIGRIPNRVSYRLGTQVAISSQAITSETFADNEIDDDVTSYFATEVNPGVLGENDFSKSAQLMVNNNKLYVYYSVGNNTWTTTDGVETEKHNFGAVKMAYMQLPTETETTDYTTLDNYIVYQANANGAAPTDENGVISIPSSGTTNLIAGTGTSYVDYDNPVETEVDGIFDSSNYTEYNTAGANRVTYSQENHSVKFSGTSKTMFNNFDAGAFKISSTLTGRASDGYMQSGYILHMNPDSLKASAYNSAGYVVFIRRASTNKNASGTVTGYAQLDLVVRYCNSAGTAIYQPAVIITESLDVSKKDYKFGLAIEVDESDIYIKVTDETVYADGETAATGEFGTTYKYALDATSKKTGAPIYNSGTFAFVTNGATTYSDLSITKTDYPVVDTRAFEKAENLNANGVFTLSDATQNIYGGFSFHVQDAAAITAGLSGYTVKLLQTSGDLLKLEFSVYELNEDKSKCTNKKSYAVDITDAVIGADGTTSGAKIALDVTVIGDTVTATATNYNNSALTHTQVYDLNNYYTYAEYGEGGYGIYKHGTGTISVEDVSFTVLPLNVDNITDDSIYTVYSPEESAGVTYKDNTFINNDATTKKIMLNDVIVSDIKADATFEVGFDGNIKGGIIFRANNVGNAIDAMEGYSVAIWKNAHTTGNYGRIVLFVYKWGRNAEGEQVYLGEVARLVDTTSFNSVYPDAKNDMLSAAGAHIKVNAEVEGDNVTAWFEVLDANNVVAATSGELNTKLNEKAFASEANATVYNAGATGVSISTLGKICDFNLQHNGLGINDTDVNDYVVYSSNTNTMVIDDVNDKIYSTTTGHKQAVLSGRNASEFDVTATLKSTKAGAKYNMSFDFAINESTHSGTCATGGSSSYMFEGYRVQLTRSTGTDKSYANLRLYKFERVDNGDGTYGNKRTELKNIPNADFFADYDEVGYGEVEVVLNVKLVDGVLYADAYVKDYPNRTLSYTYTEGMDTAEGAIGWYIEDGGSVTMNNIYIGIEDSLVTVADCKNGFVYAGINSGAAGVGDDVAIVPVANDGYRVDTAYASVNGEKAEVAEGENGYVFAKKYGATEISATFFLVGDTDNNDKVDAVDITNIRKELLGTSDIADKYADVNDDTAVNLKDLVKIKKISVGIE